jgi:hypothetical protein
MLVFGAVTAPLAIFALVTIPSAMPLAWAAVPDVFACSTRRFDSR